MLKSVYAERDFALPACIGSEGINVLLRRIQNRLIDFGYVTTRVVVEPQDLRSGMLVLTVIPGKVGRIQLQDLKCNSVCHPWHLMVCHANGAGGYIKYSQY